MATSYASRLGTAPEEAVKAPCVVAATSNITLSGEQTISSVAVVAGDRVLVAGQTDASENGIYTAATGAWSRATDWNDAQDIVNGQIVSVPSAFYEASFSGSFSPGTTEVTFTAVNAASTNFTEYQFVTDIGLNTHASITTGHVFRTSHYNGSFAFNSGGEWEFTGTTTAGKAGNAPDTDGYVYDASGKQCKPRGIASPERYGALNNNSNDDYQAITDCYAYAKSVKGHMYLWAGPLDGGGYRHNTGLAFDGEATVEGIGFKEGVRLRAYGTFDALTIKSGDSRISNINVVRGSGDGAGIVITNGNRLKLDSVLVNGHLGAAGHGIWIKGGMRGEYTTVQSFNNAGDNWRLEGGGGPVPAVNANHFRNCISNSPGLAHCRYVANADSNVFDNFGMEDDTQESSTAALIFDDSFVLTGSIDPAASTTVTGVGTLFMTELSEDAKILVSGETRTVDTIANDTSLEVTVAFSDNVEDTSPLLLGTCLNNVMTIYAEDTAAAQPVIQFTANSQNNIVQATTIRGVGDGDVEDKGTNNVVFPLGATSTMYGLKLKGQFQGTGGATGNTLTVEGGDGNDVSGNSVGGSLTVRGGGAGTGNANGGIMRIEGGIPSGTGTRGEISLNHGLINFEDVFKFNDAVETVTTNDAELSITDQTSDIDSTSGALAITLPDGSEGLVKRIVMTVDGGDATVTPDTMANGTAIIFTAVGQVAWLEWRNAAGWHWFAGDARVDNGPISVVSGVGATRTLLATENGSTCLFDRAAGIVYTLPAPVIGLKFTFIIQTTITSNAAVVITDAGSTFMSGGVQQIIDTSATSEGQFGDGSSHVKIAQNGTTTGGIKGSRFTVECIDSNEWNVSGILNSSGTLTTPFSA